ncbi:hypothetical protein BHM03_00002380 [Ensete ventricosum]|nr:hypothetical protein BHM03_00002380 [Ensete ventricosum]
MVGSAEMMSMSLMRENPQAGGASWNYTLGSSSSTAASVDPARRVRVSLRRAGDPHRGGQGCARGFRNDGGDILLAKRRRIDANPLTRPTEPPGEKCPTTSRTSLLPLGKGPSR